MADDFTRWLRMVRPSSEADNEWTTTADADDVLDGIHRHITRSSRSASRRSRALIPVGVLSAAAAVVVLVTTLSSSTPPARHGAIGPVPAPLSPAIRPAAMTLHPFSTCADLLAGLRTQTAEHVTADGLPGTSLVGYATPSLDVRVPGPMTAGIAKQASGASGTSTTNVQEPGVDEPDIVKTDGTRVTTITDGVLRVLDAATHTLTGTLDLTLYSGWQDAALLVSGEHATVILGTDSGLGVGVVRGGPMIPTPYGQSPSAGRSTVLYVDLHGTPAITGSLRLTGSYLDARMIGSTVRLVASSTPTITLPTVNGTSTQRLAAFRKTVMKAPLSAWLPTYTVASGASSTTRTVPCDQVSHPVDYTGASMLTVYTTDLAKLGDDPEPISVAADGDTVYATQSSLYVASNPQWWCCEASSTPSVPTEIHRFDITGTARPVYLGSGSVPGRLLSQYSLSEYGGMLRMITSTDVNATTNGLYILDANSLQQVGHVGGLGNGQQIYAVRFLGALAYVVTFRQTDPLYVIDLSNPRAPRVAGSLELTGYSDYLHDAGNGRLIGVGQEANAQGTVAGLQVSLFDVGNGAAPKRTSRVVLPGVLGEQTLDPHQFLYWAPNGLIVVPTQSWTPSASGRVLVLRLSGTTLQKVGLISNPGGTSTDDQLGIQRSLIVDGALWTVSGSGVQVSDQRTLARVAWVAFG